MKSCDYFAVMEQSSPENVKSEILEMRETPQGGISYLRFKACMQSFGQRNRNSRLWNGAFMQSALKAPHILELLQKGFPGENGHPVPMTGQVSMQRIMSIDPNNISHKILNFQWVGDTRVYSDVETVDDIDGPGARFARNIMQGFEPAFSVRALVPQRKNQDGSIDVTGPGRVITYDRVFLPSHTEAYRDTTVDVKRVVTAPTYQVLMESLMGDLTNFAMENSENVKSVLDGTQPVMESAMVDEKGILSVATESSGRLFIPTEKRISHEIANYMKLSL